MKTIGIVRHVDDLGRIVIPKEIRRTMHIREGDPLEIYIDETTNTVCFKKYSYFSPIEVFAKSCYSELTRKNIPCAFYDTNNKIIGTFLFPDSIENVSNMYRCPIYSNGNFYGYIAYKDKQHEKIIEMIANILAKTIDE